MVAKSRRGLGLARNIGVVIAASLAALLLCEILLRVLGVNYPLLRWTDPIRGVAHIPNTRFMAQAGRKRFLIQINRDGWRRPDVALEHPAGTFRIALLGDSFIDAVELPIDRTAAE